MFLLILHFKTFQFMDQPENWYSRNIKETIVCSLILCVLHQETAALPVAPAVVTTSQPAPCVHHRAPAARGSTSMWSTSLGQVDIPSLVTERYLTRTLLKVPASHWMRSTVIGVRGLMGTILLAFSFPPHI